MSTEWIESMTASRRFGSENWSKESLVPVTTLDMLIGKYGVPDFCKIDVEGYEYNVLRGLTQRVEVLSFEYTVPEFTNSVVQCIDYLSAIGPIECNYSLGEEMVWGLQKWISPTHMKSLVIDSPEKFGGFGDIYVRFA